MAIVQLSIQRHMGNTMETANLGFGFGTAALNPFLTQMLTVITLPAMRIRFTLNVSVSRASPVPTPWAVPTFFMMCPSCACFCAS
ncbi:hypothetical protein B0H63DRAFT_524176 [Podospora didyma]|uniref:Uncharacterized protein n=1 Tax=Podospora didyma TaxID=330526 RepID=A0AAE0TVV6_9PEZI|nr:hypothetical protein B0H63DRAFT_524176 [Podospora didyma]